MNRKGKKEKAAEKRQYHKNVILLTVIKATDEIAKSQEISHLASFREIMRNWDILIETCIKKDPENAHIIRGAAIDAKKELKKELEI